MARSSYIYAVEDLELGPESLRAVFTVKYELLGWLEKLAEQDPEVLELLRVTRHRDGFWGGEPVRMGSGREVLASA